MLAACIVAIGVVVLLGSGLQLRRIILMRQASLRLPRALRNERSERDRLELNDQITDAALKARALDQRLAKLRSGEEPRGRGAIGVAIGDPGDSEEFLEAELRRERERLAELVERRDYDDRIRNDFYQRRQAASQKKFEAALDIDEYWLGYAYTFSLGQMPLFPHLGRSVDDHVGRAIRSLDRVDFSRKARTES